MTAEKAEMTRNLLVDILDKTYAPEIVVEGNRVCGNYPTWALQLAEALIDKGWHQ